MAAPIRPAVQVIGGLTTYHSIDAVDQNLYNRLANDAERRAFLSFLLKICSNLARDCEYIDSYLFGKPILMVRSTGGHGAASYDSLK